MSDVGWLDDAVEVTKGMALAAWLAAKGFNPAMTFEDEDTWRERDAAMREFESWWVGPFNLRSVKRAPGDALDLRNVTCKEHGKFICECLPRDSFHDAKSNPDPRETAARGEPVP